MDRANYKLTTFDAEQNETLIKNNINQLQEWASSNKLDLILLLEQYRDEVIVGTTSPKSINRIRYSYGSCVNGERGVYQARFFLGIQISNPTPVMEDNGGRFLEQAKVGCNEKYRLDLTE